MKQVLGGVIVLLLACLAVQADDKPGDKPPSPKAQYDALEKALDETQDAHITALRKSPRDREKLKKEFAAKQEEVQARFVELAEKYPKDPVALDALLFVARLADHIPASGKARKKAVELLARNHAKSEKVGALCRSLGFGLDRQNETLLRAILANNPSKAVQVEACLALIQNLSQRAWIARRVAADMTRARQLEGDVGKETTAELKMADPARLEVESEKQARQFIDKYLGEVKPDRLVSLCQWLSSSDRSSEVLLRALLKHEKREVQGVACLTLAQALKHQADEAADKDSKKADRLRNESEKLLARAGDRYADVKAGFRGTVGEAARKELYEIRHLVVGKPAPEVDGEDQDGKKFKLSDYKGKVVLLDFWSQF
jgi:hypothetical protein